ncbi:uncharacterized protein KD926_007212 [Aspergillus affinis]|uniref:uncharacterized protein n=1 Tax=Aspergillus affinis TaxID=1070780 RepID=UPI0022FF2FFD|nr:uncharacterized protein KD926_007212 [Aspergillus affinis]KAI9041258.1 hypothetical protein KD926_007212 [Aspergillus affinis]
MLSSRSWPKECFSSSLFHPLNLTPLSTLPPNALTPLIPSRSISSTPRRLVAAQGGQISGIDQNEQLATCEYWCGIRLQTILSQSYNPPGPNDKRRQRTEFSSNLASFKPFVAQSAISEPLQSHPVPNSTPLSHSNKSVKKRDAEGKRPQERPDTGRSNPRRRSKLDSSTITPTPTEFMMDTLQNVFEYPDNDGGGNWVLAARNPNDPLMTPLTKSQRISYKINHRSSLQEALAEYLYDVERHRGPENRPGELKIKSPPDEKLDLDAGLQRFSRRKFEKYLHQRGYCITDLTVWAWIFSAGTPYQAALRLLAIEDKSRPRNGPYFRTTPPFIPLFLLRQNLDLDTFRLLLLYSLSLISGQPLPRYKAYARVMSEDVWLENARAEDAAPLIDPNMCITFVVRLLHHARQLLPQAQVPIVRALATYLTLLKSDKAHGVSRATPQNMKFMTAKFNLVLRLLALRCRQGSFRSAAIQQEAQFTLLRAMAGNQPVMPVTRQSYQAIAVVQLAHKKTSAERQFAELKAPSWPPWKEEKSGIDFQRGSEGMSSRAMRVMTQMKEAGYGHSRWEEVAGIYAGWDTDKSPTIQTRASMPQPRLLRNSVGSTSSAAIWEARLRSTRTVREAWACFLSYQDQGLGPQDRVYGAMVDKLVHGDKPEKNNFGHSSHALPGDGLEVFPEPSSARDLIYVHTEPPTLGEFLHQMLSQGIRPRSKMLASLLPSAPNIRCGLDYLCCSRLSNDQVMALCTTWGSETDYRERSGRVLNEISDFLFTAFIYLLCKFPTPKDLMFRHSVRAMDAFPLIMGYRSKAHMKPATLFSYAPGSPTNLQHAINLLMVRKSKPPEAWTHALSAISRNRLSHANRMVNKNTQVVLTWYESLELLGRMKKLRIELRPEAFRLLCNNFSKFMMAEKAQPGATEEGMQLVAEVARYGALTHVDLDCLQSQDMTASGLDILRGQFDRLVTQGSMTHPVFAKENEPQSRVEGADSLPRLSYIPSPAIFHALVRSLGFAEDYDSLIQVLGWMCRYESNIQAASEEYMNGPRMLRNVVVAISVYLEGHLDIRSQRHSTKMQSAHEPNETHSLEGASSDHSDGRPSADLILEKAYDMVTASEVLGPWPNHEEIQAYCQTHWEEQRVL